MNAAATLAVAELRMLARNRTAAGTAVLFPLAFGLLWTLTDAPIGEATAALAALQLLMVLSFTVVSAATTTLVARRQQRVLKRWRTSAASTGSILAGTLAPLGLLVVGQMALLTAVTITVTGARPASPALLVGATLAGTVTSAALAFVVAAYTRTPESATITVTPVFLALAGGGMWAATTPAAEVTWPMIATGGGAVAQLARLAWEGAAGGVLAHAWPPALALAVLTAGAAALATRVFRWDPRP